MMRLGSKKEVQSSYQCTIRLLDDSDVLECEFQSYHKGRYVLDYVFSRLNLLEKDYFGLRFVDQNKQRHWLDPNKNIVRQVKELNPMLFCFRVKFYPVDSMKLHEEVTRYYLFLQLRRDLLHGRLYCLQSEAATLAAYILQADSGDWNPGLEANYVSEYKLLMKQTPKMEEKIRDLHKTLEGLPSSAAELYFLKKAATIDTYGVDPYPVKDHRGVQMYLGLNHSGILTFQGSKKTHHFRWNEIQKLNYEGKMFIIHLVYMERKHTVGFKCSSASACRNLWKVAVEQRLFYTMDSSNKKGIIVTGGSFFSRGTRFRYQGKCEREVLEESLSIVRAPPPIKRISLKNVGRAFSVPTTPADSDNYENVMGRIHRPLPYIDRSASLDEEVLCNADSPTPAHELYPNGSFPDGAYCSESTLPPISQLETLVEDTENKFHQTSLPEGAFSEHEASNDELGYYDRANQTFNSLPTKAHKSGMRKRLYRHPAIKDDDYPSSPPFCGYLDEYDRDTSSTETLGPPTEPLDAPLVPPANSREVRFQTTQQNTVPSPRLLGKQVPLKTTTTGISQDSARQTLWKPGTQNLLPNLYHFSRVFIVTFICVTLTLSLLVIIIFETEFPHLEALRSSTELVLLRVQYYEPFKQFLTTSITRN